VAGASAFAPSTRLARASTRLAATKEKNATPLPASVKPGVVTGKALDDLLQHAQDNKYAIPAVNVVSSSSISGCLEAAKEFGGPMIIQFSRGGGQVKSHPSDFPTWETNLGKPRNRPEAPERARPPGSVPPSLPPARGHAHCRTRSHLPLDKSVYSCCCPW
jgi:hypothetical protein